MQLYHTSHMPYNGGVGFYQNLFIGEIHNAI